MAMTQVHDAPKKVAKSLSTIIKQYNTKRIFIVTGRNLYSQSGAETTLSPVFRGLDIEFFRYAQPNPNLEDILRCAQKIAQHKSEIIIGIGGGTAMDIAKASRFFLNNSGDPMEYFLGNQKSISLSNQILVQIPTTSGTGSEITQFAAIYINGVKYSLDNDTLRADHCILDPQLTMSMSPQLTAITALDALSQAIESFWSVKSDFSSRFLYSIPAMHLIAPRLDKIGSPLTFEERSSLLKASHLSGLAISFTRTTAAHAVSYVLTSEYGIPHGLAVALTLPSFFIYNYNVNEETIQDPQGVKFVQENIRSISTHLGRNSVEDCSTWLKSNIERFGFSPHLRDYGIKRESIEKKIVPSFNEERGKNNPRKVSKEKLVELLLELW